MVRSRALLLYLEEKIGEVAGRANRVFLPRRLAGELWGHGRANAPALARLGIVRENVNFWSESDIVVELRINETSSGAYHQSGLSQESGGYGMDAGRLWLVFVNEASPEGADVVLINTCGFIEPAVSESLQVILDMAETLAGLDPRPHLVVTGCLVSRYGQALGAELPEVDLFLEIGRQGARAASAGTGGAASGNAIEPGDGP